MRTVYTRTQHLSSKAGYTGKCLSYFIAEFFLKQKIWKNVRGRLFERQLFKNCLRLTSWDRFNVKKKSPLAWGTWQLYINLHCACKRRWHGWCGWWWSRRQWMWWLRDYRDYKPSHLHHNNSNVMKRVLTSDTAHLGYLTLAQQTQQSTIFILAQRELHEGRYKQKLHRTQL